MPMDETLKFFASLGVGGVLAGVIFYFYQQRVTADMNARDRLLDTEIRRSDMLMTVVKENTASNTAVVKSVEANTQMVERLCRSHEISNGDWNDNDGRRQQPRSNFGDKKS